MRTKGEVEITKRAVEAFVALQSQRTGLRSEVHPWPGGDERGHDADALVIFREGAGFLRVLVEATRCLQGPIEPYGSGAFRLDSIWHELKQIVASTIPPDRSVTIYWRYGAHGMLGRPAGDFQRKRLVENLLATIAEMEPTLGPSKSKVFIDGDVPRSLQPLIRTIANATNTTRKVVFRYPFQLLDGTVQYTDISLSTVGIGPADVNQAIMEKLAGLRAYRKRASVHRADQIWLLLVADGRSAASILSPISFVGRIPNDTPALGTQPNFDAIYLVAQGSWSRRSDPLGPTEEWLLVPLWPRMAG